MPELDPDHSYYRVLAYRVEPGKMEVLSEPEIIASLTPGIAACDFVSDKVQEGVIAIGSWVHVAVKRPDDVVKSQRVEVVWDVIRRP